MFPFLLSCLTETVKQTAETHTAHMLHGQAHWGGTQWRLKQDDAITSTEEETDGLEALRRS